MLVVYSMCKEIMTYPGTALLKLKVVQLTGAMFTLYWIVKRSVVEGVSNRASVHTKNATLGIIFALEPDLFAPLTKYVVSATQRSICSCSHCTGSVFATFRFTVRYSVKSVNLTFELSTTGFSKPIN